MDTSLPPTRAMSSESSLGGAVDTFSQVASLSSTPPTTVADSMSLASDGSKNDLTIASDPIDEIVHESVEAQTTPEPLHLDLPVETHKVLITEENRNYPDETHKTTSLVNQTAEPVEPSDATPTDTPTDTPARGRTRRARLSEPVYNIAQLSGTAIHGKRRSKGDVIYDRKRRTLSGAIPTGSPDGANTNSEGVSQRSGQISQDGTNAPNMQGSMNKLDTPEIKNSKKRARSPESTSRRISTRSSGPITESLTQKVAAIGKKGKKAMQRGLSGISRELRKLQDTNEYAGIDTKPVLYSTWAKGKLVGPEDPEPARKKAKIESPKPAAQEEAEPTPEAPIFKPRQTKKWLDRGLYSGQEAPVDIFKSLTPAEKKSIADFPELVPKPGDKPNKSLPAPMFNGLRLLIRGKDFKLPYDICNPLPPGQPKPEGWRTMTKNRFVGNAAAYWKKTPHFKDYQSKCVCTPEDGCTESCQNRIMLYECDDTNCNSGSKYCQNRAFARLTERTKVGGKYRVGVEVVKTDDRGYGIRANRCFEPGQIIMEYTGEIITEEECDRRMNEKYKDNQCYYLMSFDQNMIIDATTGSIARFVNHSCSPNCHMIKWIVSGQPRMALFAGDRPIMTGEELTYDYNFDPFSAKNVQKCLCGSPNCRGVLGPRPKEVKEAKPTSKASKQDLKKAVKDGVKAGKRKLQELIGDKEASMGSASKKRKTKTPTPVSAKSLKRPVSSASLKSAKNVAAKVVRKTVSTISVNTKGGAKGASSPASSSKVTTVRRKSTVVKTYSKGKPTTSGRQSTSPKKSVSRKSSLTIVAATGDENQDPQEGVSAAKKMALAAAAAKEKPTPTRGSLRKSAAAISPSPRKGLELARVSPKIRLVQSPSKIAS